MEEVYQEIKIEIVVQFVLTILFKIILQDRTMYNFKLILFSYKWSGIQPASFYYSGINKFIMVILVSSNWFKNNKKIN